MIFQLLFVCLNYFWLSWDPQESAGWYCDQHCFKIGSEVVESVWDVVMELAPEISEEADEEGISRTYRYRRHSKPGKLWHPLSVWNGLCRSNLRRSLLNADAIFQEHYRRTGTRHQAWRDCLFLMERVEKIDFTSQRWKEWVVTQNGTEERKEWFATHDVPVGSDRNTCFISEPPQCINEGLFPLCRKKGGLIAAYRAYYNAKTRTVSGGRMRYYHSLPPPWLRGEVAIAPKKVVTLPLSS